LPAPAKRLTHTAIAAAAPREQQYRIKDTSVPGLYVEVLPTGTKSWRLRYRVGKSERMAALGTFPTLGLEEARELARERRKLIKAGGDPVIARRAEREQAAREDAHAAVAAQLATASSLRAVCAAWRAVADAKVRRQATIDQRKRELDAHVLPALGHRHIDSITRAEVSTLLQDLDARIPAVARNVHGYLHAIFEHAADTGLSVARNPTPSRSILRARRAKNHLSVGHDAIGDWLKKVEATAAGDQIKTAFWLVALCATRKNEVVNATWGEFDLDAGLWTIPAGRMKAAETHVVPLSRQALERLEALKKARAPAQELLFTNRRDPKRPMADRSLNALLERAKVSGDMVMHGLRGSFSSWGHGVSGADSDVVERCLAHVVGNSVRRAYDRSQRLSERRALLQRWADHLDSELSKAQKADSATQV